MTKDEELAMDLALEALEEACEIVGAAWTWRNEKGRPAITAIKQATALDKKAENARELGLDYEPVLKDNSNYRLDPPVAEPVVFYRCNGCGHAYEQFHPTSCDCMEAEGFDRVEYYTTPPNVTTPPAAPVQEPLEYWNAVEGWVKIDEVRQHFDSVGCGTIYKNAGEDRVPLYTAAKRQWVGLTQQDIDIAFDDTQEGGGFDDFARAIEQRLKEKNT